MRFLFVICLAFAPVITSAEIVKNAKGESIDLKPNGTWQKVGTKATVDKVVSDGDAPYLDIKDGSNNTVKIQTFIKIEGQTQRPVKESEIKSLVNLTSFKVKLRMKNEYSFVPKSAMATLKDDSIDIYLKYVGKNSYGADVVGSDVVQFVLQDDGFYGLPRS